MAPRVSWIAIGVFVIIFSQNVLCKKLHLVKKKEETVSPLKKSIIGNFDLKAYAKSIKPEDCRNRKTKLQCHKLMSAQENACLLNRKYMSDNCILECRFCSPYTAVQKTKRINKECKDHHVKCSNWAKKGDCLHYAVYMMDVCKKSCETCGSDNPKLSDKDERCPMWGKTGFCEIKKKKMKNLCPYSCKKYAKRHYIVKYAKPPKRRSPRPKPKPKPIKPTARPTPPLTEDEREDIKEALAEYAEEEETRLREREEQRKQKDEGEISPIQAPPVLRSEKPSPFPVPALQQDDLNIDVPSEYEGGTPPEKQHTRL